MTALVSSSSWRIGGGSLWRLAIVTVLGFASGLPLALTAQTLQAWLGAEGLDIATIGFLGLVGLPYTFKFLWAPLMDRFDVPFLGRRRGWMVLVQLALGAALWALSRTSPGQQLALFAALAVLVAFLSASQDVVIDAYRADVLEAQERGLGASLNVMGYRLAMIVSGGLAFVWTDAQQGGGATWPQVYAGFAALMLGMAVVTALAAPPVAAALAHREGPSTTHELRGFVAVLATVALGVGFSNTVLSPLFHSLLAPALGTLGVPAALQGKWVNLAVLLTGLAVTLPSAVWVGRRTGYAALVEALGNFWSRPKAGALLGLVVLFKLGDAFAGALLTTFLLQGMAFTSAEVGVVNKVVGLWVTIGGALLGGLLMLKLGLWRSLLGFGALQMLSNLGFWWLAVQGKGAVSGWTLPAFDWGFVKLVAPTTVDGGLLGVVVLENLAGGMGTAAFVALLMALCDRRFTATQFALLSALSAVGRVWVGPMAGVLVESIGWAPFFWVSTVAAFPGLWLLWRLRGTLHGLQ